MTEAENLAQKLEGMATIGDMGRKPDAKDVRRQAAKELRRQAAEIEELRVDAECFRLWVHEAWHSPGDICRLLMNCETPADYRAKLVPLIEGQRAAIGKAMG